MPPSDRAHMAALLTVPIGQVSLRVETRGCFHAQRFDLPLSWTPSGFHFQSSVTDTQPDSEQCTALLRRLIAAASLSQPEPQAASTTSYECVLSWSATATDSTSSGDELRWRSSDIMPDE